MADTPVSLKELILAIIECDLQGVKYQLQNGQKPYRYYYKNDFALYFSGEIWDDFKNMMGSKEIWNPFEISYAYVANCEGTVIEHNCNAIADLLFEYAFKHNKVATMEFLSYEVRHVEDFTTKEYDKGYEKFIMKYVNKYAPKSKLMQSYKLQSEDEDEDEDEEGGVNVPESMFS